MTLQSMTGFANISGAFESAEWVFEARSVNNRGLDLRIRLPEGCEALEPRIRQTAQKRLSRGGVTIGLKLNRTAEGGGMALNPSGMSAALAAMKEVEDAASNLGVSLAPATAGDVLDLRGVWESVSAELDIGAMERAMGAQVSDLIDALVLARTAEGAALQAILTAQIDRVDALTSNARDTAEARSARSGALLRSRVAALLETTELADEARLQQDLAMLAVKADVTEELDRLEAHVAAARHLLRTDGPVGRKFDFLMQEFNREANTLCSKSGATDLTALGLELKVVIDQMREQVQNVE